MLAVGLLTDFEALRLVDVCSSAQPPTTVYWGGGGSHFRRRAAEPLEPFPAPGFMDLMLRLEHFFNLMYS